MKYENRLIAGILILTMVSVFSACRKSTAENYSISPLFVVTSTPPDVSTGSTKSYSAIRNVDFANFTYLWTEEMSSDDEKTFTLKKGKREFVMGGQMGVALSKPVYADVTGDGAEEALINLIVQTGGTAIPNMIYVYTLENKKPKLLWSFETGDRAIGGFKKIYAENGELVVETFGDSKFENGKWVFVTTEGKFKGYCCPTLFSRNRFKWNGEKFVVQGAPEIFDYDWVNRKKND